MHYRPIFFRDGFELEHICWDPKALDALDVAPERCLFVAGKKQQTKRKEKHKGFLKP